VKNDVDAGVVDGVRRRHEGETAAEEEFELLKTMRTGTCSSSGTLWIGWTKSRLPKTV